MRCDTCGRENRGDARFCDGCGAELSRRCRHCDRALRAEARFCDGCGRPTEATPPSAEGSASIPGTPPPSSTTATEAASDPRSYTPKHLADRILNQKGAIEGERKHVTVLFADVANFTTLSEGSDPEEMHALMDRCFQRILDQVHRYEGTVNQFTGDGVMALFGAPLALEDAPRRAVLAALGLQRALAPLDAEVRARFGAEFRLRIGIHSGPVVVGRIGDDLRMDYTAVGDTTNLASRLQNLAAPGAVLVSEATQHLVPGFFELRDLGARGVKGKSEPVRCFEVQGERAVSGRVEAAAETGLTPYVGRERELAVLRDAFEAARAGRGHVVMLVGEAGIGKSRLLYEFRERLAGEPHVWLEGRCSAFGGSTAFQSIIDALRRGFGIDDADDDAAAVAKIERAEAEFGNGLGWALPYLRQLLSLPVGDERVEAMDSMSRRSETFRAIQAWLLRAAERAPLVLAVEDLHWMDSGSQEFLTFLADSVPAARLLLVLTYRPGYEHALGDRSYHVRLALQALSPGEMSSMAASLLASESMPRELRDLIATKAEGNPFFVEEVTKSLLEEGALRLEQGRVELARSLADISVPDSIQGVLMARLDRLAEGPKRAIQVASVIGREFALRLLAQVREAGDRVQDVVGELRSLELIYEKAAHPELAYMFKHALTHDVAYESILMARRKTLHRIVGVTIQELYPDRLPEHYEALAHHFERGEDWEQALLYRERAAQKAAQAYANQAAIDHYRRALAIADRPGVELEDARRSEMERRLGQACFAVSRFGDAGQAYLRAAAASGDESGRARNLGRAALSFIWEHDYDRCLAASAEATESARACGDATAEALARTAEDLFKATSQGPTAVPDGSSEAIRLAELGGDAETRVFAISQHGLFLEQAGCFRDSVAVCERALAIEHPEHESLSTLYPRWVLGLALSALGQYGRALAVFSEGLELCERSGDSAFKARILNTLGWLYAEFGCHRIARGYNVDGEALGAEMVRRGMVAGAPELYANAAINLANDHTALGETGAALALLEPLRESLDRPDDPWQRWRYAQHVHDGLARAALAKGDPEGALRFLDDELAAARRHDTAKMEARALELRGRALVTMDRRDEAEAALTEALAVAQRIEYPPVIWRALSLRAELARRTGDDAEAVRLARGGRELVERLAASLPQAELQREFRAMGEALATDPVGAYR